MTFTGEKILIISPESWGKSMLSKHHYAIHLAEMGNEVWFLLPPWADTKLASEHQHPKVHLLFDSYSIKGARFIPSAIRRRLYRRKIRKMQAHCGVKFTLIWSFDNSRFFDLDCFENAFRIHHMMDFHTDYQIKIASQTAHLCLGVTSGIVEKMRPYNLQSHFIQHGYAPVTAQSADLPNVQERTKALYTGNLLMPYIQWPWLHALVKANPEVHFFFAGSYNKGNLNEHLNDQSLKEVKTIAENVNVTLLGECTPPHMQSYFQQVDLLYFAYRSQEFPEILGNSHKIMAYLASGKPIVCHTILEYKNHPHLLHMADSETSFIEQFQSVVAKLPLHRSPEQVAARQKWALDNTYDQQIMRIYRLKMMMDQATDRHKLAEAQLHG
jgi:glycosyltransferase involved in cell wall biosynthesis